MSDRRDNANNKLTFANRFWWQTIYLLSYCVFSWFFRFRAWGINNIPPSGPILLVSNHQSFLDPLIIGLGSRKRPFGAMARASLWANPIFGKLISTLNAVPIERGGGDVKAMRKCMEVINHGHALLIFPEGTRTADGRVGEFASGTLVMIRRTMPTIVPVAIQGAFECWPRTSKLPRPGRVGVQFGEPISPEQVIASPPDEAIAELRNRVESMRQEIKERFEEDWPDTV